MCLDNIGSVSSQVTLEIPKIPFTVPFDASADSSDIRRWLLQHYQEEILSNLIITVAVEGDDRKEEEKCEGKYGQTNRELTEANMRLTQANNLLMKASAAQLENFACISHEIRTPLNCILGLSSLLLSQERQRQWTPSHTESIKMIASSGDLLLTVVNDVLDYAKLESGNVEIHYQKRNLQETLNSIVYSLETKAAQQDNPISVRTFWDDRLPEFVTMDNCRLQQILYNIMGNALKFSSPGGVIEFSVSVLDDSSLEQEHLPAYTYSPSHEVPMAQVKVPLDVLSSEHRPKIRYRVKDFGKGVEAKDFPQIFEPFRQAGAETEQVFGGTGLGLPVTAKLVHAMNGTISVDSNGRDWTEFTVDLPFYDTMVDLNTEEKPSACTIFLIGQDEDDSLHLLETVKRVCGENVEVELFSTMEEMEEFICGNGPLDRDRAFVCMVHEDLYEPDAYDLLKNLATSLLVTFGPNYSVRERSAHFRSPNNVLPSVLLRSLRDLVASTSPGTASSRRPSLARSLSFSSVNSTPASELQVLIAEDNVVNQKVLHRLLDRVGVFNVTIVDNGKQAVEAVLENEFDVVFMDNQMPVMDGMEACRIILNHPDVINKPKIVFATAQVSPSMETKCREAGAHGFIAKPFSLRDIEVCVSGLGQPLSYGHSQSTFSCWEPDTETLGETESADWVPDRFEQNIIVQQD